MGLESAGWPGCIMVCHAVGWLCEDKTRQEQVWRFRDRDRGLLWLPSAPK